MKIHVWAVRFRPQPHFQFEHHDSAGSLANACRLMKYDWKDAGEEWSELWGNSAAQWFGAILPRVGECLPARIILEIGAGFGRWTHYLRDHCEHLHSLERKTK